MSDPFDAVVGQANAVEALRARIARTGGAGATLVLGPEGVGRFLLARCAACLMLEADHAARERVEAGTHPDLSVLEPEAGIDGVRDVVKALRRRPAVAPRQVLILRDADRMSHAAHNALLKTLEEPPAGAALLVVAEDESLLPETVVSRCGRVRARRLFVAEVAEVLRRAGADPAGAEDAEGSPGRALFRERCGIREEAESLLDAVVCRRPDALARAQAVARKRPDEDAAAARRRMTEALALVAARLRRGLPGTEGPLRSVADALGSLRANGNPAIVLADLALLPWKKDPPPS